ncbi:major coat protein [Georgfuchsia toluolica]|nr:major coat protein [Georgfuchsia toluolica]
MKLRQSVVAMAEAGYSRVKEAAGVCYEYVDGKLVQISGAVGGTMLTIQANATSTLPQAAQDFQTAFTAQATEVIAWMWTIGMICFGGIVLFKLFKKGTNKGT